MAGAMMVARRRQRAND